MKPFDIETFLENSDLTEEEVIILKDFDNLVKEKYQDRVFSVGYEVLMVDGIVMPVLICIHGGIKDIISELTQVLETTNDILYMRHIRTQVIDYARKSWWTE